MKLHYLDSSAWIKRYFNETGSTAIGSLFDGGAVLTGCRFGLVEVIAATSRRARHEKIDPARIAAQIALTQRDFALFTQVALTDSVWELAGSMGSKHALRGADAVHLAAAMTPASQPTVEVEVVAYDLELIQAARAEGLNVSVPASIP